MNHLERLGELVGETVKSIREGLSPTDALLRVSEAEDLKASDISYVAGQVNRAGHLVHMIRTSGAERILPFPLADAEHVIAVLKKGTPVCREKSSGDSGGDGDSGRVKKGDREGVLSFTVKKKVEDKGKVKKTASSDTETGDEDDAAWFNPAPAAVLRKAHAACLAAENAAAEDLDRLASVLEKDLAETAGKMGTLLSKAAGAAGTGAKLRAFLRRASGAFGADGRAVAGCIHHLSGSEEPFPDETVHGVLPQEPVYRMLPELVETRRRLAALDDNLELVCRMAASDSLTGNFMANLGAGIVYSSLGPSSLVGQEVSKYTKQRRDDLAGDYVGAGLGLKARSRLKGLNTRRVFMDAILSDPNLRGYPLRRLVGAFNDTVQTDPDILHRPAMLRAGMMHMLSSPVPDLFTMGSMVATGEKASKARRENIRADEARREAEKKAGDSFVTDRTHRHMEVAEAVREARRDMAEKKKFARERRQKAWGRLKSGLNPMETVKNVENMAKGVSQLRKDRRQKRDISTAVGGMSREDLGEAMSAGGFRSRKEFEKRIGSLLRGEEPQGDIAGTPVSAVSRAVKALGESQEARKRLDDAAVSAAEREEVIGRALDSMTQEELRAGMEAAGVGSREELEAALIARTDPEGGDGTSILGERYSPGARALKAMDLEAKMQAEAAMDTAAVNTLVDQSSPEDVARAMQAGGYASEADMIMDLEGYINSARRSGKVKQSKGPAYRALQALYDAPSAAREAEEGTLGRDVAEELVEQARPETVDMPFWNSALDALNNAGLNLKEKAENMGTIPSSDSNHMARERNVLKGGLDIARDVSSDLKRLSDLGNRSGITVPVESYARYLTERYLKPGAQKPPAVEQTQEMFRKEAIDSMLRSRRPRSNAEEQGVRVLNNELQRKVDPRVSLAALQEAQFLLGMPSFGPEIIAFTQRHNMKPEEMLSAVMSAQLDPAVADVLDRHMKPVRKAAESALRENPLLSL